MTGIEGKVVAITGASSGIGEATAIVLAERGASVLLGGRRSDRLNQVAGRIVAGGGRALACDLDVTRMDRMTAFVGRAVQEYGRLDVLINNAGVSRIGPVGDLDVDGWSAMIDVNLRGVLHGIAAALPVFTQQRRGHFVTTVSTAGLKIVPEMAVYAATKNAVRTLLEGVRQEYTDGSIRTTSISPGYVRTELADSIENAAAREQIQRGMREFAIDAASVAGAIAFAIEQPDDVEIGDLTIRPTVQG